MLPHLMWLKQVDFVPLTYAGDTYSLTDRAQIDDLALGYVLHNLALLALPVALGAIALAWHADDAGRRSRCWSRGANPASTFPRRSMSGSSRPWWRSGRRSAR